MENPKKYAFSAAVKTTITELSTGNYFQGDEQNPNYVLTADGRKIYRLHLLGIILSKEKQGNITNLLLDDGTGKIMLRYFEENKILNSLNVGGVVLVIGRLRIYNQERYISPEIVKVVDSLWLKVRALELKQRGEVEETVSKVQKVKAEISKIEEELEIVDEKIDDAVLPVQKILGIIKELDQGNGVLMEELIVKSPLPETEELLETMLKNGEIFQIMPGRVKVL